MFPQSSNATAVSFLKIFKLTVKIFTFGVHHYIIPDLSLRQKLVSLVYVF